MVRFSLPRALIGKSVQLTAIGGRAVYVGQELPVSRLGVFHTVSLQLDRAIHPNPDRPWLPINWLAQSQFVIRSLHREAKYRNILLTALFAVFTVCSVFVGLAIEGLPGLAAGAALTVAALFFGNYASGFSRGI
jgi:hypothetical protein